MPKMTFIERDGNRREVDAPAGLSVLEIAHKHKVDIEGACEGSLACSTCHVIVDAGWYKKLKTATEDEEDMLDLAFGLTETSRLGCQIIMSDALDGLIVTLPGPDEDHNPETAAQLADVLRANPAVPYDKRIEAARLVEDLTASYQGGWYSVISLHGGGSPEAMKQEIWRNYPVGNKVDLVERLLERNVLADPERKIASVRQPGKCCDAGCTPPSPTTMVALPDRRRGVTPT